MGGQLALILITNWHIMGLQGIFLAMILSIPFSILLGYVGGVILNRAKGKEMITSMILGYFINGVYQLVVLYSMGKIFPVKDKTLLLSSGRGIKNTVDLTEVAKSIREDYLQQNAFMESDTYTSLEKQDKMLDLVLKFYDEGLRGLENGAYLNEIVAMQVRERIARAKYLPEAELNKIDEVAKELEKGIDELVNKGGVANA